MTDATSGRVTHWDGVYANREPGSLSWFQETAAVSLDWVGSLDLDLETPVIDVGGGTSPLVDGLLDRGHRDVTVLDVSEAGLAVTRDRLGGRADRVQWITADLLEWVPERRYGLWHDRAVFHFLTEPADRERYRALLRAGVEHGGAVLLAAFAPEGPTHCSGLPVARHDAVELAAAVGAGFTVAGASREEHHTPWGAVQPFTWVQMRRDTT